jgi:amino acid transporter
MEAAGYDQPDTEKPKVIGIAFVALTAAVLLHVCSRRGGIIMNNMFACLEVLLLLAIIIIGFAKASGKRLGGSPRATPNFNQDKSFSGARQDPASYTDSLVFICYAYAGFDQPFYVLSESKSPRGRFPKYTVLAMSIAICLYVLVNVAYLCAVPEDHVMKELLQPGQRDMATMFFGEIFGNDQAKRVMSGLIAFSILGNIVVITFTAARVKQEIAKEGIIPFSLFFATGNTSLYALLKAKFKGSVQKKEYMEQTPTAALALHWVTSVILIAVTAMLRPTTAYSTLVTLYSYVIVILVGFFVSGGLLYLTYFSPSTNWRRIANFRPWGSPIYALIYFVACGYLLFAVFAKPSEGSPFSRANSNIEWYIIPAIGLSSLAWGVCWYLGLRLDLWLKREELKVRRVPVIVQDDEDPDQWVQECELIDHERRTLVSPHFDPEN